MMLLAESKAAQTPEPEQGVIEEARRREHSRRLRSASAALATLAALGALAAAGIFAGRGPSAPEGPLHLPAEQALSPAAAPHAAHSSVVVRVSPNLNGAEAGWCVRVILRAVITGGCAPLPTTTTPLLSDGTSWGYRERDDTTVALTASEVRSVEFSDGHRAPAVPAPDLPYGMRIAVLRTPHSHSLRTLIKSVAVFDATGRRIPERRVWGSGLAWRIWNPPAQPAKGACRLQLTGGYHANTEWGQVAAALRPYPGAIAGRGLLSCIDTEFYVPGRGMRASVLLDAAHPDRALPAPIPGLTPVPGLRGIYNRAISYGFEPLTARREGAAWLVVADGGRGGEEARIRLLRHLKIQLNR